MRKAKYEIQISHVLQQEKRDLYRLRLGKKVVVHYGSLGITGPVEHVQVQRLLNPRFMNKNLTQLYKLAALLDLEFEASVKAA